KHLECLGNKGASGSVNRGEDNPDILLFPYYLRVQAHFHHFIKKKLVCFLPDDFYFFLFCFKPYLRDPGNLSYFINNSFVVRSDHLPTVVPVGFVTIVLRWIM